MIFKNNYKCSILQGFKNLPHFQRTEGLHPVLLRGDRWAQNRRKLSFWVKMRYGLILTL